MHTYRLPSVRPFIVRRPCPLYIIIHVSMARFSLKGMGVALVTPFKPDKSIDFIALGRLLDHVCANGADYLVVLGTTGETPTLFDDEKKAIMDFVRNHTQGKVPLVLGMGGNNTAGLARDIAQSDLDGFSAILSVVPYYNKPSQEGIRAHYMRIADASPLPIILYNVPGRTGVNLSADTTLRLAEECPNIIGIKEASGNLSQIERIITHRKEGFQVISGDDSITYPLMMLGAEGVISVVGNAFPAEFSHMVRLILEGKGDEALPIHNMFVELFNLLFVDGNPAGVKCALSGLGIISNELRLPLVPTRLETDEKIHNILNSLKSS